MSEFEDVVIEQDGETEVSASTVKKLREKLAACVKEKQEYLDGWQRARADFANYKKEEASAAAYKEERIKAQFAESILPAIDAAWFAKQGEWFANAPKDLQTGIRHIGAELQKALESFGMTLISGQPPDAQLDFSRYEILKEIPTDKESEDQSIGEVFRPGLAIGDHVIRPAQVSVCVYKKAG